MMIIGVPQSGQTKVGWTGSTGALTPWDSETTAGAAVNNSRTLSRFSLRLGLLGSP